MGGSLSLESIFGKGSTFTIQLPLLFDNSLNIPVSDLKPKMAKNTKKQTFIVVDDDINLLNLTTGVLKQEQHQVFSFTNPAKALETIRTTPFDFVITDIQMPEIDGFLFLEKLRELPDTIFKNQPVIALTGRTDLDISVYKNAGFTTVIKKPYSPKILLETIQHILDHEEIPITESTENANENASQIYSLETLKDFLGQDESALKEVLKSFIETSIENLGFLKTAVQEKNHDEIKSIAHRIAPMFKQIQANEIGELLKDLEKEDLNTIDLKGTFSDLEGKIKILFKELKREI
ncbi:Aerobic respiration control sensor protein ArcB [compost metagenome]